jgi:hypothetical protein
MSGGDKSGVEGMSVEVSAEQIYFSLLAKEHPDRN